MNVIDASIILFLLLGAIIGFKKGFIKSMVSLVGVIVVIVLSFYLKEPIANFLYKYLHFFNFGGMYKGLTVINILMYEAIAFLLIFSILSIILRIIIKITGIIEKLLNLTIILGLFSKILGAILGLVEMVVFIYISLFALSQFNMTSKLVLESKSGNKILNSTPILANIAKPSVSAIQEIYELQKKYVDGHDNDSYNQEAIVILIKYKILTKEKVQNLVDAGKLKVNTNNI